MGRGLGGWEWRFPEIAEKRLSAVAERPSAAAQTVKVAEELVEAQEAMLDGRSADAAVEAMDVIHAAETLLRILEDEEGVDLDATYRTVVFKNRMRGYYGEEDGE